MKTFEQALRELAIGTPQTGQAFFEALVMQLSRVLGVRYALLGVPRSSDDTEQIQTLAVTNAGEPVENFAYELGGTPCRGLFTQEVCFYPCEVARMFPDDLLLVEMNVESYLGVIIRDTDDNPLGILVVMHDELLKDEDGIARDLLKIFARRAAAELLRLDEEAARRASEQKLRLALEAASMGVWEWDIKRGMIELAQHTCTIYRVNEEERISVGIYLDFVHPDDRNEVQDLLLGCLEGSRETFAISHRLAREEDKRRWVELRGRVIEDENGAPAKIMGTVADVTDRRSIHDQLLHSQKMEAMGKLAGGIAHDFNNLLTVIMSSTDLLAEELGEELDHELRQEYIDPLQHASNRGAALTRQLLTFAHRQVSTPRVVNLTRVIRDANRLFERLLGEDIAIELELGATDCAVYIDTNQFEQVLLNLVVNARDAMPRGGTLTIRTRDIPEGQGPGPGPWLEIHVIDEGCGMPSTVRDQAFEPFFTTKGTGKGTGLGLATSHSIIKQFGGHISLESAPGEGTTCTILLPGTPRNMLEPRHRITAKNLDLSGDEVILVVEDDPLVRRVATSCFEVLGYTVLAAQDGVEALEIADAHGEHIDLLLTDILMPRMNGDELARNMKEAHPNTHIVFTTGYVGDERLRDVLSNQEHPIVPKPYTPTILATQIRAVLDQPPGR